MIAICNGEDIVYTLSDTADISQWPLIQDGDNTTINGLEFERTVHEGVDPSAKVGDKIVDGVLVTKPVPPIVVPQSVTMRQARLALLGAGLIDTVNSAVAAMSGAAGVAARIEWEYSGEVQRQKALTLALGSELGLTSDQLDALFIAADAIK